MLLWRNTKSTTKKSKQWSLRINLCTKHSAKLSLVFLVCHITDMTKQAVRLGGRHNMPPPHLDFWPFDLEVGVGVACDLGYPCAEFRLPRPFGFRVRADVRDIRQTDRQTDRQTTDADHRLMPPPTGRGHNKSSEIYIMKWKISKKHLCGFVIYTLWHLYQHHGIHML